MKKLDKNSTKEMLFLVGIYFAGLLLRLIPRLSVDPHLLTFEADIWYRLCLAQYVLDWGKLPSWDIRYLSYGHVPVWYNPLAIYFFAGLSKLTALDLPTVCSRVMPFVESLVILPFYWLCRRLYNIRVAIAATLFLGFTPSFVFWTGICTPQGFTLFVLPLAILLWTGFVKRAFILKNKWLHWAALVFLLVINFFMHLTYFNVVVILSLVHFALIREGSGQAKQYLYLLAAVFLSQIVTAWWWLPKDLYWWWTQAISTSSSFYDGRLFLKYYGELSAVLGHAAFLFVAVVVVRKNKKIPPFYLVPLYWAVFPLLESHMEWFLHLIKKPDWVWQAFIRPIEGFRFYSFLAQPFAICFGLMLDGVFQSAPMGGGSVKLKKIVFKSAWFIVSAALVFNMFTDFDLIGQFHKFRITLKDISAAHWFRGRAQKDDKILSDYYGAQMFSGVVGGKALLGAMFPLKKKVLPYIGDGYRVLFDIYSVYTTSDILEVQKILKRYRCTHVYLSDNTLRLLEYSVNGFGNIDGLARGDYDALLAKDYSKTLLNSGYFRIIYQAGDIKILKWIGE